MDTTAGARSATFPAGSIRAAVSAQGDFWRAQFFDVAAVPFIHEPMCGWQAMLTCERIRLSAVKPAKRVEWREFIERNARGERHPFGDGYPGAVL